MRLFLHSPSCALELLPDDQEPTCSYGEFQLVTEENIHKFGGSLLFRCLEERNLACVRHLLQLGVDPNEKKSTSRVSPLYMSILHAGIGFELLVSYGADFERQEEWGESLLKITRYWYWSSKNMQRISFLQLVSADDRRAELLLDKHTYPEESFTDESIRETRWRVYFQYSLVQKLLKLM